MQLFVKRIFSSPSAKIRKALPVAIGLAVILTGALAYGGFSLLGQAAQTHANPADAKSMPSFAGKPVSGQLVHATLTSAVPALTAAQQATLRASQRRQNSLKPAPVGPVAHATAQTERNPGPPVPTPAQKARTAAAGPQINDTDFVVEQSSTAVGNGTGGPCYANGNCSVIMEPSIANVGKHVMMSGNWYDAVSHDGGAAWSYLDPFSTFTPANEHFCCDQQITYEPSRNRMFWESLWMGNMASDPNSLIIASSAGTDLSTWCSYNFTPDRFGLPTTDLLDYPDIAAGTDYLYVTFNAYDSSSSFIGTFLARLPLTTLAAGCGTLSFDYMSTNQNFSFVLVNGTLGTMYFASNWYTQTTGTGSKLRVWNWPECAINACTPTFVDRTIDTWNFIGAGSANCGSQDGVVVNWCARLDSRRGSAYMSKAGYRVGAAPYLGFAWSAAPNTSAGIPFPYTVRNYFQLAGMVYKGHDNVYSSSYAIVYPSMAVNFRGYAGGVFAYGGGTGTGGGATDYYPGSLILIDDPITPTQPWATDAWLPGQGNTDNNPADQNYQSWGDFNTVRAFSPNGYDWFAGGWRVGSNGVPQAAEVIFGRGRDHNAYLLWSQA